MGVLQTGSSRYRYTLGVSRGSFSNSEPSRRTDKRKINKLRQIPKTVRIVYAVS